MLFRSFWWTATKTTNPEDIRTLYLKTLNPASTTLGIVEPAVPPTKYSLTIQSTSVSVSFTLDGVEQTTDYIGMLYEGQHTFTMPQNVSSGGVTYDFKQWSDGDTGPTKTINLNQNLTFTAQFEPHYELVAVKSEYVFSSISANTPIQLNFTVTIAHNVSSANVTIQVYNYTSRDYATAEEGYLTFISSSSPFTDETVTLLITTDPQYYVSGGSAKLKMTSTKYATGQFDQNASLVKLELSYKVLNYDYILKVVNPVEKADKTVRLRVTDSSSVERLESLTISFYHSATSQQITIDKGAITQSQGPLFDLPKGAILYIEVAGLNANSPGTSYLYLSLEVNISNTTISKTYTVILSIN